ncbi:lasso peptide biosynthesis B2 protein [Streptomyces sp. NPDC013455]|uniref:lasso peptide biosynthesis B2 protein n=1 Tax=Streptomyces sp. NPDC013455 TaxID=3155605 RepID=UPI0033F10A62
MKRLHVPDFVQDSPGDHGDAVLLDTRSGHCFAMNPVAALLWQEWRRSRDFETGVRATARHFPELSRDLIRQDARQLADALLERGLLTACPAGRRPAPPADERLPAVAGHGSAGGPETAETVDGRAHRAHSLAGGRRAAGAAEVTMAADPEAHSPRPGRLPARHTPPLGLLGLLIALVLIRLPFRVLLRVVRWTSRHWCRHDATGAQGAAALAAVRQAAARYPGRAACLETSLASLMLLALRRRRATWCIGTAADPFRFHAWIETAAGPVMAADEQGIDAFRRILAA